MSDLIWGIVLALVAGTVIPFATAQSSEWIKSFRDRNRSAKKLYRRWIDMSVREPKQYPSEPHGTFVKRYRAWLDETNGLRARLLASFGRWDANVVRVTRVWGTHVSSPEANDVMRLWANGYRWAARRLARKSLRADPTLTASPRSVPPAP